jgi:regulator of ribonuclease activity A
MRLNSANRPIFMTFFTADFCDEYSDQVQVLAAGYNNYGGAHKCEGEIVTVALDKYNGELIKLLRDTDGTGKVVVVDVQQEYYAVVGEKLMEFALQNNFAGIVINGYVRDTEQITDVPVGLYAIGTCPRKYIPTTVGQTQIPLTFGGVSFQPGDYLYADKDGIIVTATPLV